MTTTQETFRRIHGAVIAMEIGMQFTLSEAYGAEWEQLDIPTRRAAAKLFKHSIARCQIRGAIYICKNSRKTFVYKRIPATPAG